MTDARAGAPAGAGAPGVASFGGIRSRAIDGGPLEGARLFRSASLSRITEHEAAFVVGGLGVRSIYDLRNRWEVASSPEPRIVGAKTLAFEPSTDRGRSDASRRLVAGVIGEYGRPEERMSCNYRRYAREFPLMGTVLRTMAAERLPALVHCEHGKDRTGVLCAVLQRMSDDERAVLASFLEARPTYLRAFFDEVEGCVGGFPAYVRDALRLTPVQVASLRALLAR